MTALVGPGSQGQVASTSSVNNSRVPPMAPMYGLGAYGAQNVSPIKRKDAADDFFLNTGGRNSAYDLAEDYNRIFTEDRPGQSEEINQQIRPVQNEPYDEERPESWYKDGKYDRRNERHQNHRRPTSQYEERYGDRSRERYGNGYVDRQGVSYEHDDTKNNRQDRISHPYGYGHQNMGYYREFY